LSVKILPYDLRYRSLIRKLAFDTALRGESARVFFTDAQVLADILTAYYTDYEPESCLVALKDENFSGYLLGAKNIRRCGPVFLRSILPRLVLKIITRNVCFKSRNLRFLAGLIISFLKGEFRQPDFSSKYPATLHINLDSGSRGLGIGSCLLQEYFSYLKKAGVKGVHLATFSHLAGEFFSRNGFRMLHEGRRSYFRHILGQDVSCYVYGKTLE